MLFFQGKKMKNKIDYKVRKIITIGSWISDFSKIHIEDLICEEYVRLASWNCIASYVWKKDNQWLYNSEFVEIDGVADSAEMAKLIVDSSLRKAGWILK